MSDSMTVLGQCLAVQFRPASSSEGNTAAAAPSSDGGRTKRAHAFYRSLRNLTRGGTLPKAVANAVRSKSVERARISCPSSPSKRNSRGESDLLANNERNCSSDDAFIDRCMNNIELNSQDVSTINSSNQPDVVQSTPNATKDNCSTKPDGGKLNGSVGQEALSADTEDEPFATLKKSSPSRRSSFFNAIHASLPPVCSTASNVPRSVRSPTKSVTSQSKSPNKSLSSDPKCSPYRISSEISSCVLPSKSLDCPTPAHSVKNNEGISAQTVRETCPNGAVLQAEDAVKCDTESDSGTPTPTNADGPRPADKVSAASPEPSLLFQSWVSANSVCHWDPELVAAVGSLKLVGALLGGWLLVSGPSRALATVLHAHTHSLLRPPPGNYIASLGEVSGCRITPVHKVQFTPLGPALCWVLHAEGGNDVPLSTLRSSLVSLFPTLTPPDAETTHAALTELIKQRKVYHAGRGYSLVTEETYGPNFPLADSHHYDHHHPPFRLLSTSEALTRAHGTAEATPAGSVTHAAVQTDLADLLTHQPACPDDATDARRASLRLAKRGALLPTVAVSHYAAKDFSDVSVRAVDRSGSVLSKILRVSTPRMASFSAQFPPPEWTRPSTNELHGHSRSTQTRPTSQHVVPPESPAASASQWLPRSSSLPRRPNRPLSASSLHTPDVSSSGPSPSHRHRNQSQSPSRVPLDSTTTHNPAYFNPYRNMTFRNHNNSSHPNFDEVNSQALYINSSPYGYATAGPVETGLPPRPPPFVSHDAAHRRTLSASPRRIVNMQQASVLGHRGSPQRCPPQERYMRQVSNTLPTDAPVPPQLSEDCSLNRHTLSNSYNAVYDAHGKIYNTSYDYSNTCSARNLAYPLNEINQRPGRDGSPKHRVNESPYRAYQSPSRLKIHSNTSSLLTEENTISNLSSSIDSGILPDQRSSNRDSSEDRNRSATASTNNAEQRILDNFDEILTVEVTEESKNKHKSRLEVRSGTEDYDEILYSAPGNQEGMHEKPAYENPRKAEVAGKSGLESAKHRNVAKKYNNSAKQWSSSVNSVKSSNSSKAKLGSKETTKCNRAALQLDLVNSNTKKMAAQRRDHNLIQDLNKYSKVPARDLTSKNLGYRDTNKCEKKMYVQNQSAAARSAKSSYSQSSVKQFESPIKKKAIKSKLENKSSDKKRPFKGEPVDYKVDSNKLAQQQQPLHPKAELAKCLDETLKTSQVGAVESVSVGDNNSVRTYPSLSELNFSSLAAQKLLHGVSHNSIDTLLEVNMAAGETKKPSGPVTSTNFGYL